MTIPSNLVQRALTAIVGASVLFSVLWFGDHLGSRVFAFTISILMVNEFANLFFTGSDSKSKKWILLISVMLLHLMDALFYEQQFLIFGILFVLMFSVYLFSTRKINENQFELHLKEIILAGFGFFYLGALPLFIPMIHNVAPQWVFFFVLIVWAGDIGAYFFGKTFGKVPLFKKVSPGKTVEGACGGLLLSLLVGISLFPLLIPSEKFLAVIITIFLVYLFSQVGDLCESLIKRGAGKKDSGGLLPGHGGFMDRFDGVVFALPVMYTCIIALT